MRMTSLAGTLAFLLAAGTAYAQAPGTQPATGSEKAMTKEIAAQVVSTSADAKTITIKKEGASTSTTLPVDAAALATLKTVKSGDKVKLVCKTDSTGKETSVTDIKPDTTSKAPY